MKKVFVSALLSMMMIFSFGQMPGGFQRNGQQGQMPTGRFYGKIVDAANKGIEAVSVVLVTTKMDTATKKPKEVIVGGMLTTSTGDFSVENVPLLGKYKLKISGIGYKQIEKQVGFEMPNRNSMNNNDPSAMLGALDKDLGNLKLEVDNQVLGNVTVTASKPLLQLGVDRKVFNVDKNIVSAGGTAVDVMKNVPSVNVDIDGNVTLRNAAPQIFVDGRPTTMTLDQIPADAIESVEIITNPSAKFDASGGTAGILNIVMKKNKRVGYSGNLRASIDSRAKVGFGGDINVRQNKVNFFASGMYNQRKSIGEGVTDRTTFQQDTAHSIQNDDSKAIGAFGYGRAGLDYFIDNRNTVTISGTMVRGGMDPNTVSDITIDSLRNGIAYNGTNVKRYQNSDNLFRNFGGQLNFKHNFPKAGHEWTADVTYNKGKNENNSYTQSDFRDWHNVYDSTVNQRQAGSGENENLILQTDYVKPINDKSKYEMGLRSSSRTVHSSNNYYYTGANGIEVPAPGQNVNYTSTDNVYAAYATYTNRVKNFGYQLGLRAESSTYKGVLPDKNESFSTDYPISLFPSVFLSDKINDNNELQLNYSRRINRPGFWQLFPFQDISDPLNISEGNPALKPEFTNSLEMSYSKVFKNRDNFITSVYFKNTNNLITRLQEPRYVPAYKDTFLVTSYVNANSSYVTGLELTGKNKISKWWDLTSNLNLFTSKIDLDNEPDPDQFVSYFAKINNTFKLPKNFTIQLSGDYQSKVISSPGGSGQQGGRGGGFGGGGMFGGGGGISAAQGYVRPQWGVDAGIRYEFLKDKTAAISLNVNDIFKTRKYSAYSESEYFIQDAWRRRDAQMLRLNFSWRFGKFDASLFKRKDTKAESNINMDNANF